jgi:hypothetical protein
MMSVPFGMLDQDLPQRTRWRSQSRSIGTGSMILIPPIDFPVVCLAFLGGVGLAVAFRLPARIFKVLALAPTVVFKVLAPR